jgi:hypothetical protein
VQYKGIVNGSVAAGMPDRDPQELLARLRREGVLRSASEAGSGGRPAPLPTGLEDLDRAVGGGLPRGRITEVVGPASSGRTAFLFRVLASATSRGEETALIDPADAFDPDAAALAGVVLPRVLWVRPLGFIDAFRAADLVLDAGGFGIVAVDLSRRPAHQGLGGSAAERTEGREPKAERRRPNAEGRRPPTPPWPRLSLRAERSGSVLLSLGERREAGTFASLVLGLRRGRAQWLGGGAAPLLLDRLDVRIEILRSKVGGVAGPVRWSCAAGRERNRDVA